MKILVLGGSGFIGSYLCEQLIASGHEVTVFHQPGASHKNLLLVEREIRIVEGDFNNVNDIAKVVKGMDVVVHLISATLPGSSFLNPTYDIQMNVISSIQLFDQCVKAGVSKVIFISSGGTVYGIPTEHPIKETHSLDPISPYGISKLAIEKYLAMYHYHFGLDYTILRLSNPFGPRQEPNRGQGVIATWISKIYQGEPIEIWGDGMVVRDYLYIDDAVRAVNLAIFKQTDHKVFNVGSGKGYSLIELHALMQEQLGKPIDIVFRDMQKVDVPINVLDIALITQHLEWSPEVAMDDGVRRLWSSHLG